MSGVSDPTTAKGDKWFKIYQNGMEVTIPADIAPGDYLLRAEVTAPHVASSVGEAQFYISFFQLRVTGGGSANPAGVSFPGAYSASDPGILFNLYNNPTSYTVPGSAGGGGGSGSTPTPTTTAPSSPTTSAPAAGGTIAKYRQCGGDGWTGTGTCVSVTTCVTVNAYYSQCQ
ncbi:hypothetical protein L873DRAFT_1789540 [Choiromyces venosus 120613-1]|uniref:lytic cellulose monooxygenase (C4-dehydrogenating) n=1 Tax=Choiromyces venosus 120613-1 TaxID=1336337 RepID=A0A3N4JMY0_9PEZI|nr:hypothetical protein L873DRAFT_1789540 [Choiromyces venosus 120613-1]